MLALYIDSSRLLVCSLANRFYDLLSRVHVVIGTFHINDVIGHYSVFMSIIFYINITAICVYSYLAMQ